MPKLQNPGRYPATVADVEYGESSNGTPFLNLFFNTPEGSISSWLYCSDKSLPYTVKTLRQAFDFNGDFETVPEQVKGKECSITCEMEADDKGVDRLRVKWINAPRTTNPIPDQSNFLKTLSAKAARIPKEAPKAGAAPIKPAAKATVPVKKAVTADEPF